MTVTAQIKYVARKTMQMESIPLDLEALREKINQKYEKEEIDSSLKDIEDRLYNEILIKRQNAEKHLNRVTGASSGDWKKFRLTVDSAMREYKAVYLQAAAYIR